jgi:hypothetical protein
MLKGTSSGRAKAVFLVRFQVEALTPAGGRKTDC